MEVLCCFVGQTRSNEGEDGYLVTFARRKRDAAPSRSTPESKRGQQSSMAQSGLVFLLPTRAN